MSQRRYGAALSYVSMALNLAVAFLITPILVQALGKGQFGLFSLISSIVAYFLLMDIGLNDTVLRYVIRYTRSGDRDALATFMGVTLAGYAIVVTALLALGAVGYLFMTPTQWPKLTPGELSDLRFMYVVGLASACTVLITNPFGSVLAAHQKFIIIQLAAIATRLISAVLVIIYLQGGHSVRIVFVLNTVVQAAVCLFQVAYVMVAIRMPMQLRRVPFSYVREKLNFAGPIFIAVIVEMVYWRLDNILIGSIIGTTGLAVYSVGMLFQKHLQRLANTISKVWIPQLITRLESGAEDHEATLLVAKTARIQLLILMPMMAGIIALGRPFLKLWLGPDFMGGYVIMIVALTPYAFELIGNARNSILQVRGLYWWRAAAMVVFSIMNVALTVYLLPRIGIVGGAIGTGAGVLCGYVFVHLMLQAKTGFSLALFYRELFRGFWIVIAGLTVVGVLLQYVPIDSWVEFIAAASALVGVYALLVWLVGMNGTERGYLISFARDARLVRP
jgi:O-antigen/teichoic acid export membrane protein